jgi:BlaI family penicillinase repressor
MSAKPLIEDLSRRERQIMDIVYNKGSVTAKDVQKALPDKPGYSSVRKLMSILEEKGLLRHELSDGRYVFHPVIPQDEASATALEHVIETFFKGSAARTVISLLKRSEAHLTEEERAAIKSLIESSRQEGM